MLFNSFEFIVFLTSLFALYWFVVNKNIKTQNLLLLVASYFFYGWWDWRFLLLLAFLSITNYYIGLEIEKNGTDRKGQLWLGTGLVINLGVLGFFKYYNFFIESFVDLVSLTGYDLPGTSIKIILPVGISFYVFLSLSYIIDIYKKSIKASRSVSEVLLSLSFFPIILAGPIQRPATLLPQISRKREFNYEQAADGLRQVLWGLFAKVVIADNLANNIDDCFVNYSSYSGSTLFLGAVLYAIQIYADFSGYSNIAIGIAKLFGFNLMQNFAYPYFSRDIAEFWKKWHISLVTWFRDYLFLPLSFILSGRLRAGRTFFIKTDLFIYILASLVVWFMTGLWHGANYTFIVWGLIHGFLLILYNIQKKPRKRILKNLKISNNNVILVVIESLATFIVVVIAWIFFRSDNLAHAFQYLNSMLTSSLFKISMSDLRSLTMGKEIIYESILVVVFLTFEWFHRGKMHPLQFNSSQISLFLRWSIYNSILFLILFYQGDQQIFIYFQF
jgi:D-alanyl-lipoteichoic acid acyltransferase DltB (MBOAT superfamily)